MAGAPAVLAPPHCGSDYGGVLELFKDSLGG